MIVAFLFFVFFIYPSLIGAVKAGESLSVCLLLIITAAVFYFALINDNFINI